MTSYSAISLWQPYASLIAAGAKPYETRHWAPPARLIGQRIAIQAAKRRPTLAEYAALNEDVSDVFGFCHWHQRIPYGAVVCTARLAAAYELGGAMGGMIRIVSQLGGIGERHRAGIHEDPFGDYSPGRWAWALVDIERIDPPVPERGRQAWWTWTPPAAEIIDARRTS